MASSIWLICQYTYDTQRHWVPLPLRIVDTRPFFCDEYVTELLIKPLCVVREHPNRTTPRIRLSYMEKNSGVSTRHIHTKRKVSG